MSKRSIEQVTMAEESNAKQERHRGAIPTSIADVFQDLKGLEIPGAPSVGGKAVAVPALPGLGVTSVGLLSLPLISSDIVKQLTTVATKAPFGKGSDTLLDESVRKSWQIEPTQVSFENPLFPEAIDNLAKTAAIGLGIPEDISVQAILYKVLLYEPGGFFKKHRDTEKKDGMFATLVVQLPSVYTGGNFKVSHGEDTSKVYAMGTDDGTAPYCCQFVAHYADCEHEVGTVESGYRIALVYSLCYKGLETGSPLPVPNMAKATGPAMKLRSTLERLPETKQVMFFPLSHCYTTISLTRYGLQALKGRDRAILHSFEMNGSWKFRIFRLNRTYHECDSSEFLEDFDCSEEEHQRIHQSDFKNGEADFEEVYWTEGIDDRLSSDWLGKACLYYSCDNGGRVLSSADEITCAWKKANQIESGYTGNDGYTERETKYQCYTLMIYQPSAEIDLVMEYDICRAIEVIGAGPEKDPSIIERLFHVLRSLPQRELPCYEDGVVDAERALRLLAEPREAGSLEEVWVKNFASCINLIAFENVNNTVDPFWTELGSIFAKCSKARNAQIIANHLGSFLARVKDLTDATVKAYLIALVSVNAPNVSIESMVKTLESSIDPKWEPSNEWKVVKDMMELDIPPSLRPLLRKLYPLWKNGIRKLDACKLVSVMRSKMDTSTIEKWIDDIVDDSVVDGFLRYYTYQLKEAALLFQMIFERGTNTHVEKLSTIFKEKGERAVEFRCLLAMFWTAQEGSTRNQAWKPFMDQLVGVAIKETVERLLDPSNLQLDAELVHFLFANGSDEDIVKLLEIVDSKKGRAAYVRERLLKMYKSYEGSVKGKHAWEVVIPRLEKAVGAATH